MSIKDKKGFICDMDGVIYHGNHPLVTFGGDVSDGISER